MAISTLCINIDPVWNVGPRQASLSFRARKQRHVVFSASPSESRSIVPVKPYGIRLSSVVSKQVVSIRTGSILGFAIEALVNTAAGYVASLRVQKNPFMGPSGILPWQDVMQVGDVLLVNAESVLDPRNSMASDRPIVGLDIILENGTYMGKIRDFAFDPQSSRIVSIILDEFGQPLVPSFLVSTFEVSASEIMATFPDQIMLRGTSYDRIRQRSKGLIERAIFGWERPRELDTFGEESNRQRSVAELERNVAGGRGLRSRPRKAPLSISVEERRKFSKKISRSGDGVKSEAKNSFGDSSMYATPLDFVREAIMDEESRSGSEDA